MKYKKAIILVEDEDGKVHQINSTVEENQVLLHLLKTMQGGKIDVSPEVIDGLELHFNEK